MDFMERRVEGRKTDGLKNLSIHRLAPGCFKARRVGRCRDRHEFDGTILICKMVTTPVGEVRLLLSRDAPSFLVKTGRRGGAALCNRNRARPVLNVTRSNGCAGPRRKNNERPAAARGSAMKRGRTIP